MFKNGIVQEFDGNKISFYDANLPEMHFWFGNNIQSFHWCCGQANKQLSITIQMCDCNVMPHVPQNKLNFHNFIGVILARKI